MTRSERAAQIWPLLVFCAKQRQSLSYEILSRLIGVPRPGLGQLLEPIQSFCMLHQLPPLTCLVVSEETGLPGDGFIGAPDVPKAQAGVFSHDWASAVVPDSAAFETALQRLPSNGRLLTEMPEVADAPL